MTETILNALVDCLVREGLPALRAWPDRPLVGDEPRICLEMKSCGLSGSGMGDYLGRRQASDGSEEREIYALRLEAEVGVSILAPTALGCGVLLDALGALPEALPQGLRVKALRFGQTHPDRTAGMFRLDGSLELMAHFLGEAREDTGSFVDFELRGVLKNAQQ